ncbi:MAG: response regulator [Deltaproteobacteria bacterium]|nr:response regulator [Deltaproteobacteria bacterium]
MNRERQRILIVDDREANLLSLTRVLSALDVDVVPAQSGNAALAATLRCSFALAILDVQMPDMDGYELAQHLRGDERTRDLPIIFLTAYQSDESHALRGFEAGAVDYIVKPFNPVLLLGKVQVFLELDRSRSELVGHRDRLEGLVRQRTRELEERNRDLSDEITRRVSVEHELRKLTEELEQRVRERTAEAEAANRAKSVFLANMSHEIRTPMNAILGYAQILVRDGGLTPKQQEYLRVIDRSGDHLFNLLNDVLEMSRAEAGCGELTRTAFDSHRMLQDVEMMFRNRTDERKLRFSIEGTEDVPPALLADEGKVRQVLINLIGNAIKFTETGGWVSVRVRSEPAEPPEVRILVEVQDSGCGIPAPDWERVFRVFEQTGDGRLRGGAGLGLSISRRFARLMGGDVRVLTSEVGRGSTFGFEFAAEAGGPRELSSVRTRRRVDRMAPGQPERRVLIVDDQDTGRDLLAILLSAAGFAVRTAVDGVDALAVMAQWPPHLCLTDKLMPNMDGLELARRIRALPPDRAIPVAMISGSTHRDEASEVEASGVAVFLPKPLEVDRMFEEVGRLLNVEFLYAEDADRDLPAGSAPPPVDPAELAAIPPELLARLRAAAASRNLADLLQTVDEVEVFAPQATLTLRKLAEDFEHDELLKLLESGSR